MMTKPRTTPAVFWQSYEPEDEDRAENRADRLLPTLLA
jgi:hypothetical protein